LRLKASCRIRCRTSPGAARESRNRDSRESADARTRDRTWHPVGSRLRNLSRPSGSPLTPRSFTRLASGRSCNQRGKRTRPPVDHLLTWLGTNDSEGTASKNGKEGGLDRLQQTGRRDQPRIAS